MNRRDILGSLAAWATAASAVAASEKTSIPTAVEGWPTKPLSEGAEDEKIVERLRREYGGQKTTVIPMDVKVHHTPPEKTILAFRLTQPLSWDRQDSLAKNIRDWASASGVVCPVLLLPYGLELEVHRIPADSLSPDVSVSPKE